MGFPGSSASKESACNVGDLGLIPGLGRSPGQGNGYPLQCSGLESFMDCIVHGVAKESDMTEQFSLALTSVFLGFPGGSAGKESWYLQYGRPGFDPWVGKIPWRRERLPTPVFWPGEFHGLYSPWPHESDRTEWLSLSLSDIQGTGQKYTVRQLLG